MLGFGIGSFGMLGAFYWIIKQKIKEGKLPTKYW